MRSLVYLSPVPWASVAQRPHKFAEWFHAAHGGTVLWLDPYPSRLPQTSDLRRLRGGAREPGPALPDWLYVIRVPALPLEPLPALSGLNRLLWRGVVESVRSQVQAGNCELVIGKPSRLALLLLKLLQPMHSVYDGMDDFPAFHPGRAGRAMAATENAIVAKVDTVYASADRLQAKFAALGRPATLVHNACDPASLPSLDEAATLREPDLVGYIGTLASWFDWDLVVRLAKVRSDLRFRLIGPRHVPLPASLPANMEVRPPCAHQEAMREMARFAVGLIPFRRNTLTAAVDPVKYYEYRALGIPVLSSPFGEMPSHAQHDQGVSMLDIESDLAGALQWALSWADPPMQVQIFRQANAWAARFAEAQEAVRPVSSRR